MAQNGENSNKGAFDYKAAEKQADQEFRAKHGAAPDSVGSNIKGGLQEVFTLSLYDTAYDKWEKKRNAYRKARIRQLELAHKFGNQSFSEHMGSQYTPEQWATQAEMGDYLRSLIPTGPDDARFGLEGRLRSAYDDAARNALQQQQQAAATGFMPTGQQGAALFAPTQAQLATDVQKQRGAVYQEQVNTAVVLQDAISKQVATYTDMLKYDDETKANVIGTLNSAVESLKNLGVLNKPAVAAAIDLAYEQFWTNITQNKWDPQDAADQFVLDVQFAY
jgi:hypothetical protein